MSDDSAVEAVANTLEMRAMLSDTRLRRKVARAAVAAARPIIEAEMAKKVVSLAYGQPPDWCVENIDDDMRVEAGDVRAVGEGRYYAEDGYYVKLPARAAVRTEPEQ